MTPEDYDDLMHDMDEVWAPYVRNLQLRYEVRKRNRAYPTIVFLGHSRCGKDESVKRLAAKTSLTPATSVSAAMAPLVAWSQNLPTPFAFDTRHQHREYWYEWINAFRRYYTADLPTRMSLAYGDTVAGIRSKLELEECVANKVVDVLVWVERDVPADPTLEFAWEDVKALRDKGLAQAVYVDNSRTLDDLDAAMQQLVVDFKLPTKNVV